MQAVHWAVVMFCMIQGTCCFAGDRMNSPFPKQPSTLQPETYQTSTVKLLMTGAIQFYSTVISPADGPRSPSYPTGSAYGIQAVNQYGFFPGFFLIADRLLHESDVNLGPTLTVYGKNRYYDPVANNTYWWDEAVLPENK